MNPELAKIMGRDLNPVPGSEPAPMALVARLNPASVANRNRQKAAIWSGAKQAKQVKPPRQAALGRAPASPAISRLDMLAGLREHGSWRAFATAKGIAPRTMTRWAERYGIEALPKAPLTRELLAPAIAVHGTWKAVAKALKRREGAVLEAAHALGLVVRAGPIDADVLAAYDQAGSSRKTAALLGVSYNGGFNARLRRLLEARG
jgi:hypothetical protein